MHTILLAYVRDVRSKRAYIRDVHSKWGKFCTFSLWSSQGPGPWVWVQSGLVQYSVSTSQPHPHAADLRY